MLKEKVKKIYLYRRTLWDMAFSQLKAKYSGSILGISWAVINPLLIMSVITFVFTVVFTVEIKEFPLFVLSGIFPWMLFSSALSEATVSIANNQSIMRQFNLPREIIPLSSVLSNFLNFLIGWIIIYPLFLFFNPKIILLLPLLIICIALNLVFLLGLGLMFSSLNIILRDLSQLLSILLMLWFWITPVFYSIDMVPARFRWICDLNPMTPYTLYYRDVLFKASIPDFSVFMGAFLWALVVFACGWLCFLKLEDKILKRI